MAASSSPVRLVCLGLSALFVGALGGCLEKTAIDGEEDKSGINEVPSPSGGQSSGAAGGGTITFTTSAGGGGGSTPGAGGAGGAGGAAGTGGGGGAGGSGGAP